MGREVIILMGANDYIKRRNTYMSNLVMQLQMVLIHRERHGDNIPETSKGKNQIDFCICMRDVMNYITATGMCPPGMPCEADHRTIFVDIHGSSFFRRKTSQIKEPEKRYFTSDNPLKRGKYIETLGRLIDKK